MQGYSYRIPSHPVKPGTQVPKEKMKIIEKMPVKSIITSPKSGIKIHLSKSQNIKIRGFAWT